MEASLFGRHGTNYPLCSWSKTLIPFSCPVGYSAFCLLPKLVLCFSLQHCVPCPIHFTIFCSLSDLSLCCLSRPWFIVCHAKKLSVPIVAWMQGCPAGGPQAVYSPQAFNLWPSGSCLVAAPSTTGVFPFLLQLLLLPPPQGVGKCKCRVSPGTYCTVVVKPEGCCSPWGSPWGMWLCLLGGWMAIV